MPRSRRSPAAAASGRGRRLPLKAHEPLVAPLEMVAADAEEAGADGIRELDPPASLNAIEFG